MPVNPALYQPDIPQSTDQLSKSQGDILNNFGAISSLIDQDHVDFAAGTDAAGKHFQVTFPATGPTNDITLPDVGLYAATFSPTTTFELFFSNNAGVQIPFTNSGSTVVAGNTIFWGVLPWGMLLKWGRLFMAATGTSTQTYSITNNPPMPDFSAPPFVYTTIFATSLPNVTSFSIAAAASSTATALSFFLNNGSGGINLGFNFIALGPGTF